MKNCNEESIYLYDELSRDEQKVVDAHVSICTECRLLFEQVKASKKMIDTVAQVRPQPPNMGALTSSIMQAVASEHVRSSWSVAIIEKFYLRQAMVVVSLAMVTWFWVESQSGLERKGATSHPQQSATLRMPSLRDLAERRQRQRASSLYSCAQSANCDAPIVSRFKQQRNANN